MARKEDRPALDRPSALHLRFKAALCSGGLTGFRTHVRIGKYIVDEADEPLRIVVEVNGCFWHSCPLHASNRRSARRRRKAKGDKVRNAWLAEQGWFLLEVWEHEVNGDIHAAVRRVRDVVKSARRRGRGRRPRFPETPS